MSVRVMTWVWEHSRSKSTDRLVLLAIADCASDDGANAFPSMKKLTLKTGLTDRGVQRSVTRLVALGELKVALNAGPRGCNRYRVVMRPLTEVHPDPESSPTDSHPDEESPRITGIPTEMQADPDPRSPGTVLDPSVEISSSKRSPSDVAVPDRPDVERVCRHLADRIEANGSKRPTVTKTWRDAARRLLDRDGRTEEQVIRAIDWCQDHPFWKSNVMSVPKLREQYDRLRLEAQRQNGTNGNRPSTTDVRVAAVVALRDRIAEREATA